MSAAAAAAAASSASSSSSSSAASSSPSKPTGNSSNLLHSVTELQVRFVAANAGSSLAPQLGIPEDTVLAVPAKLGRYGLSEIVNHLADLKPHRPFDFLLQGEFLRTSLRRHLIARGKSAEDVVVLEYLEAMPDPEHVETQPHDEWVSAVVARHRRYVFTGSFDGKVRAYDYEQISAQPVAEGAWHGNAVSAVALLNDRRGGDLEALLDGGDEEDRSDDGEEAGASSSSSAAAAAAQGDGPIRLVTSSKDHTLAVWSFDPSLAPESRLNVLATCEGHNCAVNCVASNPAGTTFASGGWDGVIRLWGTPDGSSHAPSASKKRRGAAGGSDDSAMDAVACESMATLAGHAASVSALCWPVSAALYSASWDHSLRMWDAKTTSALSTWTGSHVILDLDYSPLSNLLATADNDSAIRLWDPRAGQANTVIKVLRSHTGFVTSVRWSPTRANMLVSTAHDGRVKVWDVRSRMPLHTIKAHRSAKGLCVDWFGPNLFVSGGSDGKLQLHRLAGAPESSTKPAGDDSSNSSSSSDDSDSDEEMSG